MSTPSVFIIESLSFEDEKENLFEGDIISQILDMGGIETEYYYIRTKKELKEVLERFYKSNFRYLHLSCHGNEKTLFTTLDAISHDDFGKLTKDYLRNKRLFLSACSATNLNLAKSVIPNSGCYSIIGPTNNIDFNDAAIIWAAFYHLMFKADNRKMVKIEILSKLNKLVNTFDLNMSYYSKSTISGVIGRNFKPKIKSKISKQ